MKFAIAALIGIFAIAIFTQVIFTTKESRNLKASLDPASQKLNSLNEENAALKAEIGYFSRPENVEKELKRKFNYRKSDEKLIIIVP